MAYLLAAAASIGVQVHGTGVQYGVFGIDLVFLIILMVIAVYGKRQWTLWAAAFQLLGVITHVAYFLKSVGGVEYLTLLALWSYLVMVVMCAAAAMSLQRRRDEGRFRGHGGEWQVRKDELVAPQGAQEEPVPARETPDRPSRNHYRIR